MKLINKFKSPNFNERKSLGIKFIIIHYTALKNSNEAISYLCDSKNKVSSHYLISQNGDIYLLVDEKFRAWHAGESFWDKYTDINSLSIGIELDFSNHKINNKYSKKMINSLMKLVKILSKKYKIKKNNILGHSDIAPFRKKDPGPKFPWKTLINSNLIFKPNKEIKISLKYVYNWFKFRKFTSKKQISIFILSYIGYNTIGVFANKNKLYKIVKSYQSHFIQSNISCKLDKITLNFMIKHFLNLLLTKN